jgi:hypothetical protein
MSPGEADAATWSDADRKLVFEDRERLVLAGRDEVGGRRPHDLATVTPEGRRW